jgi:hypothetical protein
MSFSAPVNLERNKGKKRTLYFLRCGDYLKIGITHDLVRRVRQFKEGNPYPIVLEAYRSIPAAMARQIEMSVHAELAHVHHEGEWFSISKGDAVKIAHRVIQRATKAEREYQADFKNRAGSVQPANDVDITTWGESTI